MLINLTNHPSDKWSEEQRQAAYKLFGSIVDVPFPEVDPNWDEQTVWNLAREIVDKLTDEYGTEGITVLVQGEFTLTYAIVSLLYEKGIPCVAATTERIVREREDGVIERKFVFRRFRYYMPRSNERTNLLK